MYLTMQLLEMDVPMVLALNMMDEVVGNSGSVDINGMENMLEFRLFLYLLPRMKVLTSL